METTRVSAMTIKERIAELDAALQQVAAAKKQLCRNTTEAKSRIQSSISRQLEMLRNREVWLQNQLDVVSSAKEEVLQLQSARLHKTLGVLQSGLAFPGEPPALDIIDSEDLRPDETPYISFKADNTQLRNAILGYGRIDCNDVAPLKSPFANPGQLAPSLPSHFEDYDDVEHHVLYKTLEEINRGHPDQACVKVNIPKLQMSNRIEDWLAKSGPVAKTTTPDTAPKYSFPTPSNRLSDWLNTSQTPSQEGSVKGPSQRSLLGATADPSITTWLHKIKQNPHEEEEDDFEFIDDMSGTQSGGETLETFPEPVEYPDVKEQWLHTASSASSYREEVGNKPSVFKLKEMPQNEWLRQKNTEVQPSTSQTSYTIDMSCYFTKITDELDKWLAIGYSENNYPLAKSSEEVTRPCTLGLSDTENPWLLTTFSSPSPTHSYQSQDDTKWLLPSQQKRSASAPFVCPAMEKYQAKIQSLSWLKETDKSTESTLPQSSNLSSIFSYLASGQFNQSLWLKAGPSPSSSCKGAAASAIQAGFERLNLKAQDYWLQPVSKPDNAEPVSNAPACFHGDKTGEVITWLSSSSKVSGTSDDEELGEEDM